MLALDLKIFATDVHRNSLDIAGAGRSIEKAAWRTCPSIFSNVTSSINEISMWWARISRRLVIFVPTISPKIHRLPNLISITCRTCWIYINPATWCRKILSLFHFGLRVGRRSLPSGPARP